MEFDEQHGVITKSGRPPFLMEPLTGKVTIRHDKPMRVFRLSSSGERLGQIPTEKTREGIAFKMRASNECMHYELAE
jgi:hypothetical protein